MVTANCWYSRPVMPGMKAVGMKTAARMRAMAITGPVTSSIACRAASWGVIPSFNMVLDRLHHDDRIVHHQADGQHQAKEREGVDGKSEQGKDNEGSDQRNRDRQQRNERGSPALQKNEHHDDDQHQSFEDGVFDLLDARGDGECGVQRDHIVQALRGTGSLLPPSLCGPQPRS